MAAGSAGGRLVRLRSAFPGPAQVTGAEGKNGVTNRARRTRADEPRGGLAAGTGSKGVNRTGSPWKLELRSSARRKSRSSDRGTAAVQSHTSAALRFAAPRRARV